MSHIATYRSSRELFNNLTLRELRSKYKRSFLGWTWSMVNPLANMVVYTIMFGVFLKIKLADGAPSGMHEYALWLLAALLPWSFFQNGVMSCMGVLVANSNLVKKTYFPRELLPASSVASNLVSHGIEMGLLLVAVLAFGNWRVLPLLPFLVLLVAINALAALGLGLLLSVLNVYFRDIEHFMSIFFLVWLYGSFIVFPITYAKGYGTILKLNPMVDMGLCFRSVLWDGTHPGWLELAYFTAFAIVVFIVGIKVFWRLEGRVAEEL